MKRSKNILSLLLALALMLNMLSVPVLSGQDEPVLAQEESLSEQEAEGPNGPEEEKPPPGEPEPGAEDEPSGEPEEEEQENPQGPGPSEGPENPEPLSPEAEGPGMTALSQEGEGEKPEYTFRDEQFYGTSYGWMEGLELSNSYREAPQWHGFNWFGSRDAMHFTLVAEVTDWVGIGGGAASLALEKDAVRYPLDEGSYYIWVEETVVPWGGPVVESVWDGGGEPEPIPSTRTCTIHIGYALVEGAFPQDFTPGLYSIVVTGVNGEEVRTHDEYYVFDGYTPRLADHYDWGMWGDVFEVHADFLNAENPWGYPPDVWDADDLISLHISETFPPIEAEWDWTEDGIFENIYLISDAPYDTDGYIEQEIGRAEFQEYNYGQGNLFLDHLYLENAFDEMKSGEYRIKIRGVDFMANEVWVVTQPFHIRKIEQLEILEYPQQVYRLGERPSLDGLVVQAWYGEYYDPEILELWQDYTVDEYWGYEEGFSEVGEYTFYVRGWNRYEYLEIPIPIEVLDPPIAMEEVFPDGGLRAAVYDALGKTPQEAVFESELYNLTTLDASSRGITDTQGLDAMPNLEDLDLSHNSLTRLPLLGNRAIKRLSIANNNFKAFNPWDVSQLEWLDCSYNQLTSLSFSNNWKIDYVNCSHNNLTSLSFRPGNLVGLRTLLCNDNRLGSLAFSGLRELVELDISNNNFTTVDLSLNKKLVKLYCRDSQLTSLRLASETPLDELDCSGNLLTELVIPPTAALTTLNCENNELTGLDVSANTGLELLVCAGNYIPNLNAIIGHEGVGEILFDPQRSSVPTQPGTPVAGDYSATHITLGWTESQDRFGIRVYEIYRDDEFIAATTGTSYTDTDLGENTQYTYTIVAVSNSGARSESSAPGALSTVALTIMSATSLSELYYKELLPVQRLILHATRYGGYSHDTSAMTAALQYRLTGTQGWSELELSRVGINHNSYQAFDADWNIFELPSGDYEARYILRSGGVDTTGEIATFTVKNDDIAPTVAITSPEREGNVYGYSTPLTVRGNASDNLGVTTVTLEYSLDGGATYTEIGNIDYNSPDTRPSYSFAFPMDQLEKGREHTVTLRATAYDMGGNTATTTVMMIVDAKPPAPVENFTVTSSYQYVHLMWTYPSMDPTCTAFRVYRAEQPEGPFEPVTDVRGLLGYFEDGTMGLADGKDYYYHITTVDRYGNESAPTETLAGQIYQDGQSPVIGAYLPRANEQLCNRHEIVVSAIDNYKLKELVLEYRLLGESEWTHMATLPARPDSNNEIFRYWWDCSGLVGTYELRMSVYDNSANPPAVRTALYPIRAYTAPAAPALSYEAGHKRIALSWSYGGDMDLLYCYRLYRAGSETGPYAYIRTLAKGDTGYADTVPNGIPYYYKLMAVDRYQAEGVSAVLEARGVAMDEEAPVAVISPDELVAAVGQPFTFSGAHSTDNDNIASYDWDFGDGSDRADDIMPTHTYAAAGEYTVTLTVTDDTGNIGSATADITVHNVATGESGYTLATFLVVNAAMETTPAIDGATVFIKSADGSVETTAATAQNGAATVLLKNGSYTVSVTKSGFMPRTFTLEAQAETGTLTRTVGLSTVSMVTGEITVTEMTQEEIEEAGIDTSDPNNQHVSKFEVVMEFEVGDVTYELPVAYYKNEAGQFIYSAGGGGYTGEFIANGELATGEGPGGSINVAVYPVSERFFLVIYGEARWLKEMYHVELVVINNSFTDTIEDCVASLELPDGMSLAAMLDGSQSPDVDMGSIGAADSQNSKAVAHWYVRGDEEGEYHLSATVTGVNMSEDGVSEPFEQTFTTSEPVKVYAGSALKLYITAEDSVYRGQDYHVQFQLKNVSHKSLYNLSFGLTGAEQFQVTTIAGFTTARQWTHEDFGDGVTAGAGELAPGESIVIDFVTPIWFQSYLDVGPARVEYLLKNVFVTTLEGSTTEIPYEINIVPSIRTAVFAAAEDTQSGEIYVIAKESKTSATLETGESLQYHVKAPRSGSTRATLHLENGRFAGTVSIAAADAITVSADSENFRVETDGSVAITDDVTLTVTGMSPGSATMIIRYNDGDVYQVDYTVTGQPVTDARLTIVPPASPQLQIPHTGSETLALTALYTEDGQEQPLPEGVLWTVDGAPDGIGIADGLLTVDSTAQAGEIVIRAAYGSLGDSLTLTLIKVEVPVATAVAIHRDGAVVTGADALAIPVGDDNRSVTYTAVVNDQFDGVFDAAVTWSNNSALAGVTVADGTVTITPEGEAGEFTLTATEPVSGMKAEITVQVKALAPDWSAVRAAIEATAYTYGDPNGKAALPSVGSATGIGTHTGTFSYEEADVVQAAGQATITVRFAVDEADPVFGGAMLEESFAVEIAKRPLTLQIEDASKAYGDPNPDFAHEITEGTLVGGDTLTVNYICEADEATSVGAVDITGETDSDNYDVTALSGTLTIEQAVITAAMIGNGTVAVEKVYDRTAASPAPTGQLAVSGANSETLALTVTGAADYPAAAAGAYTVALTLGVPDSGNYRLADGLDSYSFTGAVIRPADYRFDVDWEQAVDAGSALAALTRPGSGSGVGGEAVRGAFAWYTDADCTTPAGDQALSDPGFVTLYWSFAATDPNYSDAAKSGEVAVTVTGIVQPVLTAIEITAKPAKTAYKTGETLSLDGMVVTAVYSDGSRKEVDSYTTNPKVGSKFTSSGTKTVAVTYAEGDIQVTGSFTVSVKVASVGQAIVETVVVVAKAVAKVFSWLSKWF